MANANNNSAHYPSLAGAPSMAAVNVAMLGQNNSGGGLPNTNAPVQWINPMNMNNINTINTMNVTHMLQQHQLNSQDIFAQQQMSHLVNSTMNPMALTAQHNHQKLQMMQLHQRMEQQRARGADQNPIERSIQHQTLQQTVQHHSVPIQDNLMQNHDPTFMQFQLQQQQIKQFQMAQQQQHSQSLQLHQQQLLNQVLQQQAQNQKIQQPQNQTIQQAQNQQMQALEEQKHRFSIMLQNNLQTQEKYRGQVSTSSLNLVPQHPVSQQQQNVYPTSEVTSKSNKQVQEHRFSLGVGPQASLPQTNISHGLSLMLHSQCLQLPAQPVATSYNNSAPGFPSSDNTFYRPLSTSAKNKQMSLLDRRNSESTTTDQQKGIDAKIETNFSMPSFSQSLEGDASVPSSLQEQEPKASSRAGKAIGKKTSALRRQSHTQPASSLKYEQVARLINQCTTEQKIVWVARQVISSNGFQKSTSALQRMKRHKARGLKQKEAVTLSKDMAQEKLKIDTFDSRVAKKMYAEMKQGLQYSNLMTVVVRKILEDIDPDNPVLMVKAPMLCFDDGARGDESEHPSIPSMVTGYASSV